MKIYHFLSNVEIRSVTCVTSHEQGSCWYPNLLSCISLRVQVSHSQSYCKFLILSHIGSIQKVLLTVKSEPDTLWFLYTGHNKQHKKKVELYEQAFNATHLLHVIFDWLWYITMAIRNYSGLKLASHSTLLTFDLNKT